MADAFTTAQAAKDGGPAFPSHFNTAVREGMGGMSLRDYFAAKAMQGFAANGAFGVGSVIPIEEVVADAYDVADEMLKARRK